MHKNGQIVAQHTQALSQLHDPELGLCYDPLEIIYCVRSSINELFQLNDVSVTQVESVSIICQSFGLVIWDKASGLAIKPALYCDKHRVSDLLKQLTQQQHLKLYQDQIKQQLYPQSQALHLIWLMKQH